MCNLNDNIYVAKIVTESDEFNYIGMSQPPLRHRVAVHKASFENRTKNQTELSSKVWDLKDKNEGYTVKFKLLENKKSYTTSTKNCNLCTAEKYQILFADLSNLLNTMSEIMSKCRHRRKFKLTS